jgi:hypothetical protein
MSAGTHGTRLDDGNRWNGFLSRRRAKVGVVFVVPLYFWFSAPMLQDYLLYSTISHVALLSLRVET